MSLSFPTHAAEIEKSALQLSGEFSGDAEINLGCVAQLDSWNEQECKQEAAQLWKQEQSSVQENAHDPAGGAEHEQVAESTERKHDNEGQTERETAEIHLLMLQQKEALQGSLSNASSSELAVSFASLFDELSDSAALRLRRDFDSNLRFRPDGSAVDLRAIVFKALPAVDRNRVLSRIRSAAAAVAEQSTGASCSANTPMLRPGMVVISDVDDTLLPASDNLGIGGQDRSWARDGRMYPGVARLHEVLRDGAPPHPYSVLLTARPPRLCASLPNKLTRIATGPASAKRLSILPGAGGPEAVLNFASILGGSYEDLGRKKLQRLQEYMALFPECSGRFVFIGDDGQADLAITPTILSMLDQVSSVPSFAFAAIKAVRNEDGPLVPLSQQKEWIEKLRAAHPPVEGQLPPHQRFFYFSTYEDLAEQLARNFQFRGETYPGWLKPVECEAVVHAAKRDRDLATLCAATKDHNLLEVARVSRECYVGAHEMDAIELEELGMVTAAIPNIVATHVLLADDKTLHGSLDAQPNRRRGIQISITGLNGMSSNLSPYLAVRTEDKSVDWEGSGTGLELGRQAIQRLHNGERLVVKVFSSRPMVLLGTRSSTYVGRFYILFQSSASLALDMLPAVPTCSPGAQVEVSLIGQAEADVETHAQETGQVLFQFKWL